MCCGGKDSINFVLTNFECLFLFVDGFRSKARNIVNKGGGKNDDESVSERIFFEIFFVKYI